MWSSKDHKLNETPINLYQTQKNDLPSHHEGQDSRWGPGDRAGPESDNIEKLWNVFGEERISVAEVTLQEVYS